MSNIYLKPFVLLSLFCATVVHTVVSDFSLPSKALSLLAQNNRTSSTISYFDVAYGSHPEQVFDIYLPSDAATFEQPKVIILVHGGGWMNGDKSKIRPLLNRIKANYPDYAIVNMNYRLANETQYAFPDQFNDISLLVQHLTSLSDAYNITPEFGLIGKSAGGHLSLMYDALYDAADQVKFVCNIAGPTNFNDPAYIDHPAFTELFSILVDPEVYEAEHALNLLSPIYHVYAETSPTLIFHGKKDKKVPVSNAIDFAEKLKRTSINSKLTLFKGQHLKDWSPKEWTAVQNKVGEYLANFLPLVD